MQTTRNHVFKPVLEKDEKMRLELCIETAKTVSKKTDMLLSLLEKGQITVNQFKDLMSV